MSISAADFTKTIQSLHDAWNSVSDLGEPEWQEVLIVRTQAINAIPYLCLTKAVPVPRSQSSRVPEREPEPEPEPELLEEDPEALPPPSQNQQPDHPTVTYTILHSPTYLVPILYISLPFFPAHPKPSAGTLYALLVPELHKPSLQNPSIGPLGALSQTTHPETGRSCFWIHPCLTQEGMEGLGLKGEDGMDYLMGWFGIVGGGVGLGVPVEVARRVLREREERA